MAEVTVADKNSGNGSIELTATAHKKCTRCWRCRPEVGKNLDHPELCGRCAAAVKQQII
jgi:isoleucyl-tRNA synthetase